MQTRGRATGITGGVTVPKFFGLLGILTAACGALLFAGEFGDRKAGGDRPSQPQEDCCAQMHDPGIAPGEKPYAPGNADAIVSRPIETSNSGGA
jgi:hypothetical protein